MIQSTAYRTNRRGEINHFGEEDSQTIQNRNRNQSQSVAARNNQQHQRIMCGRCGAVGHGGNECRRSKNATCNTCGKIGHFQRMCKYKQSSNHRGGQTSSHHRQPPANRTRSGVNQVTEDTSFETYETNDIQNQSNESDNEYKDFTVHKIGEQNLPFLEITINNHAISALIDSGSSVNILDEKAFNLLSPRPDLQ